jgi:serine/threonine protein kinase/Tfp pilus assembly protein PilF
MKESLQLDTTLAHYRIIAKIGEGGMGEVYRARDTKLGRDLAIKVLSAAFSADAKRLRRFQQEAQAAGALNHPHIAHIYEIGAAEGQHFIAMEYVEGQSLDRKLAGRPLQTSETVSIGAALADALEEAHGKGITHRDIKPSNIVVTPRGEAKLLDFGLAKISRSMEQEAANEATTHVKTAQGVVIGTVMYMSPEQALGQAVDHRTDIFSLGAVLYEMVTGRIPFGGATTTEIIDRIVHAQPDSISRLNYDAPAELERIIRKCLEKDRNRRYQSARELLVDLRNLKRDVSRGELPSEEAKPRAQSSARRRGKAIDSLAVLPLDNASADSNMEYLSEGITESIINMLSQLPKLRVVSRSTAFRYKGRDIDPLEVGHELNVRAILTGRVRTVGDSFMIGAELIEVAGDRQLWGAHYSRKLSDIFEVQEEIAREISENLRLRLTGKQRQGLTKRHTENTEAYQLYLKGLHFFNKREVQAYERALECFKQAINLDGNYALAYAGMSDCYANMSGAGLPSKEAMVKARTAAIKALEIDDTLAEAHTSLAHVNIIFDWDWSEAETEFKRAIELNPNYAEAHHWYSHYLVAMARMGESLAESLCALELDPLNPGMSTHLGWHHLMAREYDRAIEQFRTALELDRSFSPAHIYLGHAYERKGMYAEAIAQFQKGRALYEKNPLFLGFLGHSYAVSGNRDEARKAINKLKEQPGQEFVWPFMMALIYTGLGEKDQAFECLEKAYQDRNDDLIYLKVEPAFDPLRADPRFTNLLRRVGLTP